MVKKMYTVEIGTEKRTYEEGTTYEWIAQDYQEQYEDDIVLVLVDGKLQELPKEIKGDCKLEFITTGTAIGNETYRRSMCLMMVKAIYDVAGHTHVKKVRVDFSVSKGYYCKIDGDFKIRKEFLQKVKQRMLHMVDEQLPIQKRSVHIDDAIGLFKEHGMHDKERLFQYRRASWVNLYRINEFEDYYYGYMVPHAGYLKYFELYPYDDGFVIQMPGKRGAKSCAAV